MFHRRPVTDAGTPRSARAFEDFHDWLLSLPWVVERPYSLGTPGVRAFAIDCEPLGRRQLWLVTGLRGRLDAEGMGLAVILPTEAAVELERGGWGRSLLPMPGGHALVSMNGDTVNGRQDVELLVLTAYGYAMS